jgi:type IV secretion system protein VirB4
MTRANAEQQKHTPWFAKAGAACSIVPISRFVGPSVFALKGGGYRPGKQQHQHLSRRPDGR